MKAKQIYSATILLLFLTVVSQPAFAIRLIPSDESIGIWDPVNRIYTLTENVNETIQIDDDNLTLDGGGYEVTGGGSGYGVYIYEQTNVTIKNVKAVSSSRGIFLSNSNNNKVIDNITNSNTEAGIRIEGSSNIVRGNTAKENGYGIIVYYSIGNEIYHNNFIDNVYEQAVVVGGSDNVFNLDLPIGGNYWSDYDGVDTNGDGIGETSYTFSGGEDNYPWVAEDGWVVETVTVGIDIKPGSTPNTINLGSNGVVPVAILSTLTFDATQVDPETVELAGSGVAVRGKGSKYLAHQEDVNDDGLPDLVCQVETENLDPGTFQDGYAILTGNLLSEFGGTAIEGSDTITIVPPE